MIRPLAVAMLATLCAAPALALEVGGVQLDDKVTVGGQPLVLNGAAIRSRAIFKVYVGSLYVPAHATDAATVLAKGPRRIQLNLLRNLSADQLVDALVDGLKANSSAAELAAQSGETAQLVAAMKAFGEVREGSVVTLDFVDGATRVAFNGTLKASIPGEAFNQALTRIWIGEHPAQDDLKRAMLGAS
jgi:long-chain acyl-CoA synthetase